MPTPVIEALFDSACVDVFHRNQERRRGKQPSTVLTPVPVRTDLPINVGIKQEVDTSVLSAVGSVTPAVHKEAKKRLNYNVEHLKWNDTVKVAKTLVKEGQEKQAIQAQQESIKSAVKQRDAAFKQQEELKVEIEGLGPRLQRAREGLKDLQDTYFKPGHYIPPYIYQAQRDLKRTILAIVSCLASAQDRLLKVKDDIRNFDQILFSAGAATCTLCGHHLLDHAETHEVSISTNLFSHDDSKGEGSSSAFSAAGSSTGSSSSPGTIFV